jgi:hypothetical protein
MVAHTCRVATARIDYMARAGQVVLNTTVKSGTGLGAVFAPTWALVMDSKQGRIDWPTCVERYTALMRTRYVVNQAAFVTALKAETLVVCCYCRDTSTTTRHCHRYVLVDILQKIAAHHDIGFETIGEVKKPEKRACREAGFFFFYRVAAISIGM